MQLMLHSKINAKFSFLSSKIERMINIPAFGVLSLMREGFILLTKDYVFMGCVLTPFWHVINLYFYLWYEVETLQVVRLAFLV